MAVEAVAAVGAGGFFHIDADADAALEAAGIAQGQFLLFLAAWAGEVERAGHFQIHNGARCGKSVTEPRSSPIASLTPNGPSLAPTNA